MKSIIFCAAILIVTLSACQNAKDPCAATVDFSTPAASNADFIFSTCQGKTLLVADAVTAQKVSDNLKAHTGGILSDMGIGNAFALTLQGKTFLCTARHGAVGLEKYTKVIGADIALIDFNAIPNHDLGTGFQLTSSYDLDTTIRTGDSIFIKGYLFNKKGELQTVTIGGKGKIIDKTEYGKNVSFGNNAQYMQQHELVIKLGENVELAGLSGSPAFNTQGKVIGVYSGRTIDQDHGTDTYYIRVSLFN